MTLTRLLVLWLLLMGLAWGQSPSPSPTPGDATTPSASPALVDDPNDGGNHSGHRHDFEEPYRPSAHETDKPAVFGYMILVRQELMAGTPTAKILRQSIGPWVLCALLLPIYWFLARRRGFRL